MASGASIVTRKIVELLNSPDSGIGPAVMAVAVDNDVTLTPILSSQIVDQNVSSELAEKTKAILYPAIYVYTDRVRNTLVEKFRQFSGKVRTVAEVRVSQDRFEGIEGMLRFYVDAVTSVLETNRGDWGDGAFYTGAYEVDFDPAKHGGKNFLQAARVVFEVDLSA